MSQAPRLLATDDAPLESDEVPRSTEQEPEFDLRAIVGGNLRRLRVQRGLSLERMARASGVSRAMLGQIELGQSTPTITVLWKIAQGLGLSIASLVAPNPTRAALVLRRGEAQFLVSADGHWRSRALFPVERHPLTEFHELELDAGKSEKIRAHVAGTNANLVVLQGTLSVTLAPKHYLLGEGDALAFQSDVDHVFANPGEQATHAFLVLAFPHAP